MRLYEWNLFWIKEVNSYQIKFFLIKPKAALEILKVQPGLGTTLTLHSAASSISLKLMPTLTKDSSGAGRNVADKFIHTKTSEA